MSDNVPFERASRDRAPSKADLEAGYQAALLAMASSHAKGMANYDTSRHTPEWNAGVDQETLARAEKVADLMAKRIVARLRERRERDEPDLGL